MVQRNAVLLASMEPSSVEDGNEQLGTRWLVVLRWLQWSRPQLRTETSRVILTPRRTVMLQWSGPQLRTETADTRCRGSRGFRIASMEPSSVEDGNTRGGEIRNVTPTPASMEPSSVEDGNHNHDQPKTQPP